MLRQFSVLGLALLPAALAQTSNDFESGWDQTAWPVYAPDCQQGGTVSLDSTVAHSGKNSIKVVGAGGYCGHAFVGTSAVPSGDVYVRTWLQSSKALTSDHVTFIVMPDSGLGANQHLRFGGMSNIMMYNRQSDDATLPDLSPQGIATSQTLPAGSWQCLEYHLGTDGTIETWLNDAAIPGLTVGPGISNPNSNGWKNTYKPKISGVYFGWESYGGAANTFWYDDIVVSSKRVGCSGSTPPASTTKASTTTVKSSTTVAPPSSTTTTKTPVAPTTTTPLTTLSTVASTKTTTTTTVASPSSSSCLSPKYGQCGGIGWKGCTACAAGSTCKFSGDYYSQCL